jgi:hypothetical protein
LVGVLVGAPRWAHCSGGVGGSIVVQRPSPLAGAAVPVVLCI